MIATMGSPIPTSPSKVMMPRLWMIASALFFREAVGFADNLVITKIGCMTELDTSEVIMNNVVKSADESAFPKIHLAAVDNDNHVESPYHYKDTEVNIAFVIPYSTSEFNEDVQFVMEVDGPAEFVDGGTIGCDGNKRVSSRLRDSEQVTLQIRDPMATLKVLAGWATGHSAVTLTPYLVLEPHLGDDEPSRNLDEEIVEEESEVEKLKGHKKERSKKLPKGLKLGQIGNHMDMIKQKVKGKDHVDMMKQKMKDSLEYNKRIQDTAKKFQKWQKRGLSTEEPEEDDEELEIMDSRRNIGKGRGQPFRRSYDSDDFASRLDMSSYLFGCAFFILSIGSIIISMGKIRDKGRRDL